MFIHSSKLADLKTRKFVSVSFDPLQNVVVYEVLNQCSYFDRHRVIGEV